MEISIADQIALDDALVAPTDRLKIGKCNLRLSSDVTSKEATLQVVYDVLKLTPFYKAFQVTADAPEIYMQEFWVSAYVHNRSVRFKTNNKKHILGLDQFRDILQICPKIGNKKFEEPPLEKEILIFLASLGHSGDIRKITDVNVNKLHQPWRSFAAIINKCLSGKPSYDSLRLSQAQILWGMYNKKNVDYAYLLWEDFIFQIENKNTKKGNAMYYPRFTKLVVNFVMDKDPSIPRRNKVNWHYARDDPMFTTINVISRNEDTQLYGAILPVALTNEDIRNSESYKEYYAIASGTIPPKTKGSKKKANTDTIIKQKPPTAPKEKKSGKGKLKTTELETIFEADLTEAEQLKIITKRSHQETHSSHASGSSADEGTGATPGVPDAPDYDSEDDISWKSSDDDQDDEQAQDDEVADKNDVNETKQDDEDDDEHDCASNVKRTTSTAGKTDSKGSKTHRSHNILIDLRQLYRFVPNAQGVRNVIPCHHFSNNDLEYGLSKWIEDLSALLNVESMIKVKLSNGKTISFLDWITVHEGMMTALSSEGCGRSSKLGVVDSYQRNSSQSLHVTESTTNLTKTRRLSPFSDPRGFIYGTRQIQALLRRLDRHDLSQLYSLVLERFKDHPLKGHDLDLWGALRMIFDPNEEDDICTSIQINMLVEKKYPLKKEILEKMINLKIEAEEESTMAHELIKLIKS
ncbi:hypothetical protein Tco_1465602 [Tanacetum coccineum]